MATDVIKEEFVTIVPVGEGRPVTRDPAFVTVLTVGAASGAAEIVVRRPRGARLGLGLKFEGGSAAAEKVRRLLVQSCAEDSPAAKAVSPWGKLIPGDEILAIDGVSVSELTRIDCVRRLKDSDENLILLVRHFETKDIDENVSDVIDFVPSPKQIELLRPSLPPPVPPRKLGKKNSFKDKSCLHSLMEQNININSEKEGKMIMQQVLTNNFNNKLSRKSSFDSHILRQNKESIACLKKGSPEEVRRLVRRLSDGKTMPPEAEVYIDLLSNEWERCLALADAESDDTGSSISTVVDRLSSMASSVENSIPSTPIMQPKTIDIKKVLNCIENIDSDILKDIRGNNYMDNSLIIKSEVKLSEKRIYTNGNSLSQTDNENINEGALSCEVNGKLQNDKNNNTTTVQNITLINLMNESNDPIKIPDVKMDIHPEISTPTPMPRNVKSETILFEKENKSSVANSETDTSDILLTPTKKNCIESWLMRSEAEMCVKNEDDILEDTTIPEILPRLIDFVPKPQFKENVIEGTLSRPTTAPPPPPVETREDGSGASLDTIGELDETADSSLTEKSINSSDKNKDEKTARDPTFWDDSVNKSESEDKSLSNDESPLPSCPRQPPDGVETPSDVVEKIPETPVSRLPPRFPQGWPTTRSRLSYSRAQDARSEASVKDKIAMFSHDRATSTDHLDKCGTLPSRNTLVASKVPNSYMDTYNDVKTLDRRLTKSQDNLDDVPRSYKRHSERPEALGGLENTTTLLNSITTSRNSKESTLHETKPLFYGSTNTLPSPNINSTYTPQVYHARSNSDDSTKGSHKLEYLIEQRKKSTSKLRALMIPETQAPITDLPEIKVDNRLPTSFALDVSNKSNTQYKSNQPKKMSSNCINLKDSWKTNTLPNNIPKYSPAFKRKSLQIYPTVPLLKEISPEPKLSADSKYSSRGNKLTPLKPPRQSLDIKYLSDKSPCYSTLPMKGVSMNSTKLYKEYKNIADVRDYNNMEIKICTITDVVDSDNDSAMSSTQSSYRSSASSPLHNMDSIESDSSHLSPKITPYSSYTAGKSPPPIKSLVSKNSLDYEKRNVCRSVSSDTNVSISSSAGSAATSGSQASCSSLESSINDDKKRVSKVYDIDTINRKNILASAKCRSGRDAKLNSPVVETKFSHDNNERNTGSSSNVPERLSTLTSTVSAVSSKGETRRRNKVIAASDSDTDNEINIRQRKAEFKNARLKRNSSNSKTKQNDNSTIGTDTLKNIEDAPKAISERIIKEIKKAGLDNYQTNTKTVVQKKTIETKDVISSTVASKYEDVNINGKCVSSPLVNSKRITNKETLENGKSKPNINIDKNKDDNKKYTTHIVKLKKGAGAGVGLILAGGIDCEAKTVTVHRVLAESIAHRAGLERGARVRSINGCPMAGLTHAQSVAILKEQRTEILIEIENEIQNSDVREISGSTNESKVRLSPDTVVAEVPSNKEKCKSGNLVTVVLEKAGKAGGTGLGFSIEGGRDSLEGGRPLVIKKLFQGAVAEQSGCVRVGAELLSAGGQQLEGYTRFQAWDFLKSLPVGPVTLVLRNPSS